ncbi:PREDICTED: glutaredoxin domain-containing cysteine-rich protein 2 [Lepidothrix coronata]|uniref:Glutaredoxin domain-containing cysteine-rich protein 2 n=1 Tax=Lepidothrix coronata TaxID=321398 RepID=A0A6J0HUZ4_9PASS|nr:PREDICTED: glutaredoxin domain-containing cysteine-rich protein 2 [Lepidothrix coronata]
MDEPQKKLSPRHEGRPRKVRFKISSAYSGRVLKQVYEDGQELEPPAKEHSRRFLRHSFEPEDHFCGAGEALENRFYWPTALTAQRISIFREDQEHSLTATSPLLSDCQPGASHCREGDAEHGCSQCKGSGSAPCSLCHGSKFSMLANRFRESYRALRCPACNESGLEPCHICTA